MVVDLTMMALPDIIMNSLVLFSIKFREQEFGKKNLIGHGLESLESIDIQAGIVHPDERVHGNSCGERGGYQIVVQQSVVGNTQFVFVQLTLIEWRKHEGSYLSCVARTGNARLRLNLRS